MNYTRTIKFWGILDFCSVGWFILWSLVHSRVPFYSEIIISINTAKDFESPIPIWASSIGILIVLSLIVSGALLVTENPLASKFIYIQTPFRAFIMRPSIFFLLWPLKHLFDNPETVSAIMTLVILFIVSEFLKVYSVFKWRRQIQIA